jgi:hypothetical protein
MKKHEESGVVNQLDEKPKGGTNDTMNVFKILN